MEQPSLHGELDLAALFDATPTPYLILTPELVIVGMNRARERVTGTPRADVLGRHVFEAFPDNPEDPAATGVRNLRASLEHVLATKEPHTMAVQKYDIPDRSTGEFVERYWSPVNVPVLDQRGRIVLLLHRVQDVTDYVRERALRLREQERGEQWRRRSEEVEGDLYARAQELQAAWEAETTATRRLAALAEVALRLAGASSVEDLTAIITEQGVAALDAHAAIVTVAEEDAPHLVPYAHLRGQAGAAAGEVPLTNPLTAGVPAVTGQHVLLPDRDTCLAWAPDMEELLVSTGCQAWASLPLRSDDRVLGSLAVGWSQPHAFPVAEVEILEALAAQCAVGLERIQRGQAEREAAAAVRRLSETLQRSLLTEPIQPDHLEIAVRYQPAAQEAQVGGDWYDAFATADGTTCLVIGDVTGHDRNAAAVMGQVRNLLRGVACTVVEPPAAVLAALDRALSDLHVRTLVTAVLARIEQSPADVARGLRRLRWSNAGHPPPLLIGWDGTVRLLGTRPDLLLGVNPATRRADHEHVLEPGATLLLYTDGLIERRGATIDDGLDRLVAAAGRLRELPLGDLCDELLTQVGGRRDDDVALLAMRAHPQGPQPPRPDPRTPRV